MMMMGPWFVLVVVVVVAVVWAFQRRDDTREDDALQVLDRRLAEGDLTVEEHAQQRQALQEHGHGSQQWRSGRWGGPLAVIAAALVVILLAWLGMASWGGSGWMGGHMGWGGSTSSTTEVVEGAREVEVEAGDLWFDPDTIEMTVGEPVNLRLVNTGEAFHDLTVPAADLVLGADPGEEAVGAIEFAEPGRYEFSCSVPGHEQGGMQGTIVVTDVGEPGVDPSSVGAGSERTGSAISSWRGHEALRGVNCCDGLRQRSADMPPGSPSWRRRTTTSIAVPDTTPSWPVRATAAARCQSEIATPMPPWMISGSAVASGATPEVGSEPGVMISPF